MNTVEKLAAAMFEREIARLKEELQSTDYKIIKCAEYDLINAPMPYNIATLNRERQSIRDRINRLEAKIEKLKG